MVILNRIRTGEYRKMRSIAKSRLLSSYLTFLALTLIVLLLCNTALFSSDDIKLPDIVILGEAEKLPDTISLDQLLRKYWYIENLEDFQYHPFISFEPVKQYETASTPQSEGRIAADLGYDFADYYYARLRGKFSSATNPLHRYAAFVSNENFAAERELLNARLTWKPDFTKGTSSALRTSADLLYNSFNDETTLTNEFRHLGFGLSIGSDEELAIFKESSVALAINSYRQERELQDDVNINDFDLLIGTSIPILRNTLPFARIPLKLSSIRNKQALQAAFLFDKLLLFDDIGVGVIADDEKILPAVSFRLDYYLNEHLSFHLDNQPQIEALTRYNYLLENPDQSIEIENPLAKTPLNSTLQINNSRFLPLSLGYNLKYAFDYHYYDIALPDTSLFSIADTDLLEHRFSISSAYHFGKALLSFTSDYTLTDVFIPFIPQWHHSLMLGLNFGNSSLMAGCDYLTGRKNTDEAKLDDAILLNLHFNHRINDSFSFNAAAKNILNTDYAAYSFPAGHTKTIPTRGFRAAAGLTYSF